ncbi:hypothetical protein EVAR_78078_1 [Eumeta japonica]|uniref:Uncharacterized protein n=1 Tax=Eumeta variegata TaxID=151549 RepID=A0A4C1T1C5_EUMVA|nr:hypothetical protein EVAR_78078_1 [Eumeta japonica]
MTGAVHAGTPRAGRRDSSQLAAPTDGQDIIMCSDEFGSMHQVASSFSREKAMRGGCLILIKNNIQYKERLDVVSLSVERTIEVACIEIERLVVLRVYRPPKSSYDIFEKETTSLWRHGSIPWTSIEFKGLTLVVRGRRDLQSIWACYRVQFLDHFYSQCTYMIYHILLKMVMGLYCLLMIPPYFLRLIGIDQLL